MALPADPARMMLGQRDDAETLEKIRERYGFNLSMGEQYLWYLNDLSPVSYHPKSGTGPGIDQAGKYRGINLFSNKSASIKLKWPYLRTSFQRTGKTVSSVISETLPNTVVLAVTAIIIAFVLGISMGVVSAGFSGKWMDKLITVISIFGMSVPSFFAAILIAWVFAFLWHDFTGLPMNGSLVEVDDLSGKEYYAWGNLILPALTLGIRPLAVIVQLTRNTMLEVMGMDYMRTARSKGLGVWSVRIKHGLRNALNPVITATSGWFASMLAGAVFIEFIFGWNGMGKEIVNALNTLDLPVVMGAVLVAAGLFVIINFLVDIAYGLLDPRIRIQ